MRIVSDVQNHHNLRTSTYGLTRSISIMAFNRIITRIHCFLHVIDENENIFSLHSFQLPLYHMELNDWLEKNQSFKVFFILLEDPSRRSQSNAQVYINLMIYLIWGLHILRNLNGFFIINIDRTILVIVSGNMVNQNSNSIENNFVILFPTMA